MRVGVSVVLLLLLCAFFAACRNDSNASTDGGGVVPTTAGQGRSIAITVFAASSLMDAFTEVGAAFQEANPGVKVTFNFAASTALRTQLEQGARADVFASADQAQMELAQRSGVIEGDGRLFAKNKLVVIYPTSNSGRISGLHDLARPNLRLVLTDSNVPIGAYSRTALEQMARHPQFGPDFARRALANLRSEEANVRAVVTKVQLGEADAAIVYASDVTPAVAKDISALPIPDQFNVIATYPLAVTRDARDPEAARAFIDYVRSPAGQAILRRHNFIVDGQTAAKQLGIGDWGFRIWPLPRLVPRLLSPNFGRGVGGGGQHRPTHRLRSIDNRQSAIPNRPGAWGQHRATHRLRSIDNRQSPIPNRAGSAL